MLPVRDIGGKEASGEGTIVEIWGRKTCLLQNEKEEGESAKS